MNTDGSDGGRPDAGGRGRGRPTRTGGSRRAGGRDRSDRAVSTALSYVLTLGITALLTAGLVLTAGGVLETQERATARDQLEVAGERLGSKLMAADRLADTDPETVRVRGELPRQVAGSSYVVTVDPGSDELVLNASGPDVSVRVSYVTRLDVRGEPVSGGSFEIVLDGTELVVRPR